MGSEGGGDPIQWMDTLVNAGMTLFAAVLAAGVAVWLARAERKHARDQRVADEAASRARQQEEARAEEKRQRLRAVQDLVLDLQDAAADPALDTIALFGTTQSVFLLRHRLSIGRTQLLIQRTINSERNISDVIIKHAPRVLGKREYTMASELMSWAIEFADELEFELVKSHQSDDPWPDSQATRASDESSAEDNDAKSSS